MQEEGKKIPHQYSKKAVPIPSMSEPVLKKKVIDLLLQKSILPEDISQEDELAIIIGFFSNEFIEAIKKGGYAVYLEALSELVALNHNGLHDLLAIDLLLDIYKEFGESNEVYPQLDAVSRQLYQEVVKDYQEKK